MNTQIVDILKVEAETKTDKGFLHNLGRDWCRSHNFTLPAKTIFLSRNWYRVTFLRQLFLDFDKKKYYTGVGSSTYLSKIGAEILKADENYKNNKFLDKKRFRSYEEDIYDNYSSFRRCLLHNKQQFENRYKYMNIADNIILGVLIVIVIYLLSV
jgi:hypothetical protein